jgi:ribose transport system substrate-binding protein
MRSRRAVGHIIIYLLAAACAAFARGGGEAPARGIVVGLSNGPFTDSRSVQMTESLRQQAAAYTEKGWVSTLIVQNAGEDTDIQIAQIRNLIARRAHLILIRPVSAAALRPVIRLAQDAGTLCILYDLPVSDPPCLNISMNQDAWMAPLAEWLVQQLNGTGSIVYISGAAGQPENAARDDAVDKVLSRHPGIALLAKANGNRDQAAAQQVMSGLLASFPNIDGVLTQDGMTRGILRAFEDAGRKIPVVTGETQVAFIKEWKKRRDADGFSTFGVEDSPGAVCTSLGIGVRLLQGRKLKADTLVSPNVIRLSPSLFVDNTTIDRIYARYRDMADTYDVNQWYSEDAIDALFQ